jgi:hypothetical protein
MSERVGAMRREASLGRTAVRVLALALPLFFAWEMAQAPAFTGMPEDWVSATAVCALAALGDGVIVLALWGTGGLLFGDPRWFAPPTLRRYAVIVLVGIGVQVLVEWVMVYGLGRWGYGPAQPILPGLRVGLLPLLQAAVLLPLVFGALARWETHALRERRGVRP